MCRNIKILFNYIPPATGDEVRAASIQFVRKISGATRPSRVNEAAFERAVDAITETSQELLSSLITTAPKKDREVEATKARMRARERFGRAAG
jgi:hypothetical protein